MFCNSCGRQCRQNAAFCDACGARLFKEQEPPRLKVNPPVGSLNPGVKLVSFLAIGIIGVSLVAGFISTDTQTKTAAPPKPLRVVDSDAARLTAFADCKFAIRNSLKAPSTAGIDEYGFAIDPMDGHIFPEDDHTFMTTHRVDAQNSFGAKLRKTFACEVRCSSAESCTVLNIQEQ